MTRPPEDAVTVQYLVEGETVSGGGGCVWYWEGEGSKGLSRKDGLLFDVLSSSFLSLFVPLY